MKPKINFFLFVASKIPFLLLIFNPGIHFHTLDTIWPIFRKREQNSKLPLLQLIFLLFINCHFVSAQVVSRYAILVDGPYPNGIKKEGSNFAQLGDGLEKNGFLKGNIRIVKPDKGGRVEILYEIKKLSREIQPGDVVYFHIKARTARIPVVNLGEIDGNDEVFLLNGLSDGAFNPPANSEILTDNQLSKSLGMLREKLGPSGCLVICLDSHIPSISDDSRLSGPDALNDFFDFEEGSQSSRLILLGPNHPQKATSGQNADMLTWFSSQLTGKETFAQFQDLRNKLATSKMAEKFQISGSLDEPFFHEKAGIRDWKRFRKTISIDHINGKGRVFGLVIGVSDYKSQFVDLQYAHTDALSFYNFLKNGFGPRFVDDSSYLLLNERANSPRVFDALKKLNTELQPEDMLYFYFAGHGDVEGDLVSRPGFLLLGDGPDRAFGAGGHIPMSELRYYLTNYLFKGSRVIMVVDACRSGNISGNQNDLDDSFFQIPNFDEEAIRILACHPNEFSYEGEEYGGGFGVFTYYLLKAVGGDANSNQNEIVDLKELNTYLKPTVSKATSNKQNPLLEGPDGFGFMPVVKTWSVKEFKQPPLWASNFSRVNPENSDKDSALVQTEKLFYRSLSQKQIVEPASNSALVHLNKLKGLSSATEFKSRRWSADFVEGAFSKSQSFINQYIAGVEAITKDTLFGLAARELEAGLGFLNPDDAMYFPMIARSYFFRARSLSPRKVNNDLQRKELGKAIKSLRQSIGIESNAPHAHNALGRLFELNNNFDSAQVHYRMAIQLAPKWKFPFNNLGSNFEEWARLSGKRDLLDSAVRYYRAALAIDPKFIVALNNLAKAQRDKGSISEAKRTFQKCIFINPKVGDAYHQLGDIFRLEQNWDSAFSVLEQGLAIIRTEADLFVSLGNCYFDHSPDFVNSARDSMLLLAKSNFIEAEKVLGNYVFSKIGLSNVYWELKLYDSSAYFAGEALQLDSMNLDFANYQLDALIVGADWIKVGRLLQVMDRRFPKDAGHHIKWGLYWNQKRDKSKVISSFLKAKELGAKKADFEGLENWPSYKKESWFTTWQRFWK